MSDLVSVRQLNKVLIVTVLVLAAFGGVGLSVRESANAVEFPVELTSRARAPPLNHPQVLISQYVSSPG